MSYTERIKIAKGGKLLAETWEKRQLHLIDISNVVHDHMFNACYLDDDINLKDILLLVKDHCDLLSTITTSSPVWLKQIVDEGLDKPFKKEDDGVDSLELSWNGEVRQYKGEPRKLEEWISFNGIGDPPKNDPHDLYKNWPQGEKVRYALDFSPIYKISELPVKLNPIIKVYDETNRKAAYPPPVLLEAEKYFTLIDILRGIFWELSFHGSPSERDARSDELSDRIKDVESGNTKTYSWDEVKSKFDKVLDDKDDA